MTLTPRQLEVCRIIDQCCLTGQRATLQRVADRLGLSRVTVHEHVEALTEKGAVYRDDRNRLRVRPNALPARWTIPLLRVDSRTGRVK